MFKGFVVVTLAMNAAFWLVATGRSLAMPDFPSLLTGTWGALCLAAAMVAASWMEET